MAYLRISIEEYNKRLAKAVPHSPTENCKCNGSCSYGYCNGYVYGCDCDIDYTELARLNLVELLHRSY